MSKTNRDKRGGHLFIEKPAKKFTTKAMRREANAIIQSSLSEYEEDQQSYYLDYDADDYCPCGCMDDDYYEIVIEDDYDYDNGYDSYDLYDPYDDYGVSHYDWDAPFDPIEHRVITHQDAGRSLGDILAEMKGVRA